MLGNSLVVAKHKPGMVRAFVFYRLQWQYAKQPVKQSPPAERLSTG
jgi:hypothetical protein